MTLSRAALLLLPVCLLAQAKRPLTHQDYDSWRTIQAPQLSRDGVWAVYGLFPQEGDGHIVARNVKTGAERREDAGALPPPPERTEGEEGPPRSSGPRITLTRNGRYVVFGVFPSKKDVDAARKEKKDAPKNGLAILDLNAGAPAVRIPNVKSFQAVDSAVAYLKEAAKGAKRDLGTELVYRDLATGAETTLPDAVEYSLSRDGRTVLYTVSAKDDAANGVYAFQAGAPAPAALVKGKGKYGRAAWDLKQTQAAFSTTGKLFHWKRGAATASELSLAGARDGLGVTEKSAPAFSRDGARILLSTLPQRPARPAADASSGGADRPSYDLWHWRDPWVQPMQKVRASQERDRAYRAVYHVAGGKFLQLADRAMPGLATSEGRMAIGLDDSAYRPMIEYDAIYSDLYLVDMESGDRRKIFDKGPGSAAGSQISWSPDGRYAVFYQKGNWHSIAAADGRVTNLTASLPSKFWFEEIDRPQDPEAYGSAGWSKDGSAVLLYDRHDVWQVAPDGSRARNLTQGAGRKQNLEFRIVRLDRNDDEDEPRGVDLSKPLTLRAESRDTRDTGFWTVRPGAAPEKLVMQAANLRALAASQNGAAVLLTASTFNQFPDLRIADAAFRETRPISDANPQKKELLWGSGELISYKNLDGVPLKAALYKPENFDPNKKYPVMVYIYERLSQIVHNFVNPAPGTSINFAYYVSNGYLVLTPDIVYTVGAPGQSALKCVLPAIQALVDKGYVDESRIGIQGHSWGGYQIAYMVTQTNRFRAAEAGAPVGNMTSAYNGIRWGSGLPRQFQYEKAQSRIGGSLWDMPMKYLQNSPVFAADRISTPLLLLHNDADDAVPWQQGIELFLSLRRLGKEAYMVNYNGEKHGIRRRINQKDYTVKMQQFFDHFLKDAPRPEWMEKGRLYWDAVPSSPRTE